MARLWTTSDILMPYGTSLVMFRDKSVRFLGLLTLINNSGSDFHEKALKVRNRLECPKSKTRFISVCTKFEFRVKIRARAKILG